MLCSRVLNSNSAERPRISVLIPAFNEEQFIAAAIDSVRESFRAADCASYELIVCDNNSTDQTAAVARTKGATVVFEGHNQISRARNAAAAVARGEWLIFLDADTHLSGELLSATMAALDSLKVCGGGSVIHCDADKFGLLPSALLTCWNTISRVCRLAAGSYVFCARQAWIDVGGFDERYYAAEELFFSRRVRHWGKQREMRFVILTGAPIVTSARKFEWYGGRHLLGSLLKLSIPGALKRRERCGDWYTRPEGK